MAEQSQGGKGWVDLTLPSQGIFYKDADGKERIPTGKVKIRKLTVSETATLQSPGMDALQRVATVIRSACQLPPNIAADELLLTDRQAILLYQRVITHGPVYSFTYRCPGCRATVKWTTNIIKDLVEVTPDELRPTLASMSPPVELEEPFDVELPDEAVVVTCRLLRGKDESEITKRAKRGAMQSIDNTDPSVIIRMALVITAVNGEAWDTRKKEQMVRGMTQSDQNRIEYAVDKRETGVDTTVYPTCTACGYDVMEGFALPFDRDFFRSTDAPAGINSGTQVLPSIPRKGVHGTGS